MLGENPHGETSWMCPPGGWPQELRPLTLSIDPQACEWWSFLVTGLEFQVFQQKTQTSWIKDTLFPPCSVWYLVLRICGLNEQFVVAVVQSPSRVLLFATPWTAANNSTNFLMVCLEHRGHQYDKMFKPCFIKITWQLHLKCGMKVCKVEIFLWLIRWLFRILWCFLSNVGQEGQGMGNNSCL